MFIHKIETLKPKFQASQEESLNWLAWAHKQSDPDFSERLLDRVACKSAQIKTRYFELEDYSHTDPSKMRLFGKSRQPNMTERTAFFKEATTKAFEKFYTNSKSPLPTHLIHTTCTGYISPSVAQEFAAKTKTDIQVFHAYHMGCYAAIPSLEMAKALCSLHPNALIDIVHTELCTLHMNPTDHSPEQLVVQSLFADGYAKVSVNANQPEDGLKILATKMKLIPESAEAMKWSTADWGMQMTLSREVPKIIADHLKQFIHELAAETGLDILKEWKNIAWAIHPGGPKILDSVKELLELEEEQISLARKVLFEHGNMSSATIPHILEHALNLPKKKLIVALAFGPGLTIAGSIFERV